MDRRAATFVAVTVVALGLWPHLAFSIDVGELTFFKSAFDEDSYLIHALVGFLGSYRLLSTWFEYLLFVLSGHSATATFIVMDVVLPLLAALAALSLSRQITAVVPLQIAMTLLLLFGQDFFSLGNVAVWSGGPLSLGVFRSLFGTWGAVLVPGYETSFLGLFRSPEPQLSYILLFTLLGWLVRMSWAHAEMARRDIAVIAILMLLLPFGYVFLAVPAAVLTLGMAAVHFFCGNRRPAGWLALFGATSAAVIALESVFASVGEGLIYASRLPAITPAVLASAVSSIAFAILCFRRGRPQAADGLAFLLLAMPAFLCNQQIVSGVMVSARDWERSANYPLLLAGLFLAMRLLAPSSLVRFRSSLRITAAFAIVVMLAVLVGAQRNVQAYWRPDNVASLAMVRALAASFDPSFFPPPLLLDRPALAPLLRCRRPGLRFVADYTRLFAVRVPSLGPSGELALTSHAFHIFEYWWRIGTSPEEVEKTLRRETAARTGYFLAFFFSFRDAWFPATDNRLVRQADIEKAIPGIVDQYRKFRRSATHASDTADVIRLTDIPPQSLSPAAGFTYALLGVGEAGNVKIYAYRQRRN